LRLLFAQLACAETLQANIEVQAEARRISEVVVARLESAIAVSRLCLDADHLFRVPRRRDREFRVLDDLGHVKALKGWRFFHKMHGVFLEGVNAQHFDPSPLRPNNRGFVEYLAFAIYPN
jgi:hypothetical protein